MKCVIATAATLAVLAVSGCSDGSTESQGKRDGPNRDNQGRLQNQDNPALDGLNPEKDCPNPGLEACNIYYDQ